MERIDSNDKKKFPESRKPYYEAKENGTLPEYYLERFRRFRDDYKDDLPATDVRLLATLSKD